MIDIIKKRFTAKNGVEYDFIITYGYRSLSDEWLTLSIENPKDGDSTVLQGFDYIPRKHRLDKYKLDIIKGTKIDIDMIRGSIKELTGIPEPYGFDKFMDEVLD